MENLPTSRFENREKVICARKLTYSLREAKCIPFKAVSAADREFVIRCIRIRNCSSFFACLTQFHTATLGCEEVFDIRCACSLVETRTSSPARVFAASLCSASMSRNAPWVTESEDTAPRERREISMTRSVARRLETYVSY